MKKQGKKENIKTDCFGYRSNHVCGALSEMLCARKECPFYKTAEKFAEDAKKAKIKNIKNTGVKV